MSLIGHWPLHDDSGSATDYSGSGNHGSPSGGPTRNVWGRMALPATSFDGVDDKFDINDSSLSAFTYGGWFYPRNPDDGNRNTIIRLTNSNDTYLYVMEDGTVECQIYDGSNALTVTSSSTVSSNEWHFALAWWDGSTLRLYLDGEFEGSASVSTMSAASRGAAIGGDAGSGNGRWIDAVLSDMRVYDRALSSAEIQSLYNMGLVDTATPPSDGVSYYPLDGDLTFDGFEDGDLSEWDNVSNWSINTNRTYEGSYSAYNSVSSSQYLFGERTFSHTAKSVEVYWQETSNSYGHGYQLLDSNGNRIAGFGSANPQWTYVDSGSGTNLYNGDGYNRWIRTKAVLDPTADEVTYTFEDLNSGTQQSTTVSRTVNEVVTIQHVNVDNATDLYNQTNSGSNTDTWTDSITFSSGIDTTDVWGSNNGTNNGASLSNNYIKGGSGLFDRSNSDYINIGTPSVSGSITLSTWFNTNSTSHSRQSMISSYVNGEDSFIFGVGAGTNSDEFSFFVDDGSNDNRISSSGVVTGNWYHMAAVYNSQDSVIELYVNGVLVASTSITINQPDWTVRDWSVGSDHGSTTSNSMDGYLDDARIYNYALSPHEIRELYQFGTIGRDLSQHLVTTR